MVVLGDKGLSLQEEHRKLSSMVAALKGVIMHGGNLAIVVEAVSVLRERFQLHCQLEEREASGIAPELRGRLVRDHGEMKERLKMISTHALAGRNDDVRATLEAFLDLVDRHEREVDSKIFG